MGLLTTINIDQVKLNQTLCNLRYFTPHASLQIIKLIRLTVVAEEVVDIKVSKLQFWGTGASMKASVSFHYKRITLNTFQFCRAPVFHHQRRYRIGQETFLCFSFRTELRTWKLTSS